MSIYDRFGKGHEVTTKISDTVTGYDEPAKWQSILIDGISIMGGYASDDWKSDHYKGVAAAQRFLNGDHHPTHYTGVFAHLART